MFLSPLMFFPLLQQGGYPRTSSLSAKHRTAKSQARVNMQRTWWHLLLHGHRLPRNRWAVIFQGALRKLNPQGWRLLGAEESPVNASERQGNPKPRLATADVTGAAAKYVNFYQLLRGTEQPLCQLTPPRASRTSW